MIGNTGLVYHLEHVKISTLKDNCCMPLYSNITYFKYLQLHFIQSDLKLREQ